MSWLDATVAIVVTFAIVGVLLGVMDALPWQHRDDDD